MNFMVGNSLAVVFVISDALQLTLQCALLNDS